MSKGNETIIISNNLHNSSIKTLLLLDKDNNKIGEAVLSIEKKETVLKNIFIEKNIVNNNMVAYLFIKFLKYVIKIM